jgi:hypothetical protein
VRRARTAGLVLCLFILNCVLLSQGLKANALSTLLGALAAVPLTVHLYRRVLPAAVRRRDNCQQAETACREISEAPPPAPAVDCE